ncbi:thiopeptide-type bacteriocin biosynthesis domain-containing protein [Chitinophaga jiangningensis]|uniref:Thiopeptide-type bacteriocin biosynthesis domain-containing protein n=1 Tax=Chitinophaga jiangningensis TaxID=1419482 RepID=A0A1M7FH59_9BACT|nr:lantibiotic dehydratase [Chitinophaga jiangningensis]SHM03442.1 thiopeptide-type bacteriocin biosynthesis domain-containing protein [Chitinophaga jiangningensis]
MHDRILMPQVKSFDFYLLRLPLLSYNTIKSLHTGNKRDVASLTAALKEIYRQPVLQEAIYLASQELHTSLLDWLSGTSVLRPQKQHKLVLTLYKYLLRMSARCTPYGLFAGCSTGSITDAPTAITIDESSRHKKAKIDMHCLSVIADELVADPEIAAVLTFLPNSSIYRVGNTYRYYEYQIKENKRHYFLSSFSHNIYLEKILSTASNGASIQQLTAVLMDLSITADEAKSFISMLVENQILVSAFHPTLTGPDYLSTIAEKLRLKGVKAPLQQLLTAAQQHLVAYEKRNEPYNVIGELLQKVSPGLLKKDLVVVDLFHETPANNLHHKVIDTITQTLSELTALNVSHEDPDLAVFKKKYTARYEGKAMPLMSVLDSENGIGFGILSGDKSNYTPVIDDLVLPSASSFNQNQWTNHHKLVLRKFAEAQQHHLTEIVLTSEDLLEATPENPTGLPATSTAMGNLLASSTSHLDAGDFRFVLKSCGGPSALPLMGRFGSSSETLADHMRQIAAYEKMLLGDKIIAEIIHLPQGRTGNVLLRPKLYDYEIPFLGTSSLDKEFQIPVSDIYVNVVNDNIILFSKSLHKEIVPRLTSAHNFNNSLSVYKFLCAMQSQQESMSILWDWNILQELPYLPRVRFNEVILRRAQWRLLSKAFLQDGGDEQQQLLHLLNKNNIPEKVILAESDNELFLDLSCVLARDLLISHLKKGNVTLFESFLEEEHLFIRTESGAFCNEIVVPLYNNTYTHSRTAIPENQQINVKRTFSPGSEWLYAKVYCGPKWVDKLLTTEVYPIVNNLKLDEIIHKWFFIRYVDNDNHLRLRFHLTDPEQSQTVINEINQAFQAYIDDDIIHKIQFDTYTRELERYGADIMDLCEQIFYHDSELVLELLPHIQSGNQEFYRWIFAVKATDTMLESLGYNVQQKLDILSILRDTLFTEFNGNNDLQFQLNNKFREHQQAIAGILDETARSFPLADVIYDQFSLYGSEIKNICTEIRIICGKASAQRSRRLQKLTGDLLHMMLNRFFLASPRLHELVTYHCLTKHYTAVLAKEKTSFNLRNLMI